MKRLCKRIDKWQRTTFPRSTVLSKMKHLKKEIVELDDELLKVKYDHKAISMELADCFILLIGIAGLLGVNVIEAIKQKFKILKKRDWGKPDKDGVYLHIEK